MAYIQILGASVTGLVKGSPGRVLSMYAVNANAARRYLQLFEKTTVPVTNDNPKFCFPIEAGRELRLGADLFGSSGLTFAPGCSWGISTAMLTFTPATPADHAIYIRYQ